MFSHRFPGWIIFLIITGFLVGLAPKVQAASPCGAWQSAVSDSRASITLVSSADGNECRGAFIVRNETALKLGTFGFGGYGLELDSPNVQNATTAWITIPSSNTWTYLSPLLDMQLNTFPTDRSASANVSIQGKATPRSIAIDTAFFVLTGLLDFIPGKSCVVPDNEIVLTAINTSQILVPTTNLALDGDFIGASQELNQVMLEFIHRSADALAAIGVGCASDFLLKSISADAAAIAQVILNYLAWIPVNIVDYVKYQGQPVSLSFAYKLSSSTPTPTVSPVLTSTPQQQATSNEIAYVSPAGDLWVANINGTNARKIVSGPVARPEWSHDGTRIAYLRTRSAGSTYGFQVEIATAHGTGQTVAVPPERNPFALSGQSPYTYIVRVRWAPDDSTIYWAWTYGNVSFHFISAQNLQTGTRHELRAYNRTKTGRVEYSPVYAYDFDLANDATTVLAVGENAGPHAGQNLYLLPSDGHLQLLASNPPIGVQDPTWSPDGTKIATISRETLGVINRNGTGPRIVVRAFWNHSLRHPSPYPIESVTWSPDGKTLVYSENGFLWSVPVAGGVPKKLFAGSDPAWQPVPAPISLPATPKPGGTWISPANGSSAWPDGGIIHFAAHAYPTHPGDPPIDHVNFTIWWPALGPKTGPWKTACVAKSPANGDVFQCDADLAKLGAPAGNLSVSFDVYDLAGNKNLSPNGERTVDYQGTIQETTVIVYQPPAKWDKGAQGYCWGRSEFSGDGYRCMTGNFIQDPCYPLSGNPTAVVCPPLPLDTGSTLKIDLTKPLPAPLPSGEQYPQSKWPALQMQLADGAKCNPVGGAYIGFQGKRVNYVCTDHWSILGEPTRGTVWTAQQILVSSGSSPQITKTRQVTIAKVWL